MSMITGMVVGAAVASNSNRYRNNSKLKRLDQYCGKFPQEKACQCIIQQKGDCPAPAVEKSSYTDVGVATGVLIALIVAVFFLAWRADRP